MPSESRATSVDILSDRLHLRRKGQREALTFLLKQLLRGAQGRKQLFETACRSGRIGSEATFQNYVRRLEEAGLVRRTGSKARVFYEITPLGASAAQRTVERVVTIREDSAYLSLDAQLATNVNLQEHDKKSVEQALSEITRTLDQLAVALNREKRDVAITLIYTFKTRRAPGRVDEILEKSRNIVASGDPRSAEWIRDWHERCVMALAQILQRPSPDAEWVFDLLHYRASMALVATDWHNRPEGTEVLDLVFAAINRIKADYNSETDDVWHIATRLLVLDIVHDALNELDNAVMYASGITRSIPTDKLLETKLEADGTRTYSYLETLRRTYLPQILLFESWLRKKHGQRASVEDWGRHGKYYNAFLSDSFRGMATSSASLAMSYLSFIQRFPPDPKLKSAIDRYLKSRKTDLERTRRLLEKSSHEVTRRRQTRVSS